MKRVGILLIGMVLLAVVSTATVQRDLFVKADGSDGTDNSKDFERFWSILSNVSALVVEVNSSPNYDNVHELIKWTRLGEENAGNISALAWKSLQELKDSGIKLYYTESELKEMADEISQEGLPAETVQVLKEQGWTDEQINALVSYIQDHSDEIVGDFDFGAYLEAFSYSFIEVGKKYAEYGTWALEKYYWRNALSDPPSGDLSSNPYVSSDTLSKLDHAASTKNADELLLAVNSLRSDMEFVIEDAATAYYTGGGVKFSRVTYSSLGKIVEVYYWPNALKAYRLVSELYTVAVALKEENSSPDLWNLVREYQKELSSILGVYLVSTTLPPTPGPSPMPVPFEIGPYSPTSYALGSGSGLVITNVEVVKTDVNFTGGFVKYRVRVDYNVYGGAVFVEWAKFNDGGESKLVNLSTMVYSGQGVIESPEFVAPVGDSLRVPVSGLVKVQYRPATSPGGDTPYARPSDPVGMASVQGDASAYTYSSPAQPVLLMKSYQEVIDLTSQLDPGKVRMEVVPSKDVLYEGDSVSFKLKVENENALPLSGYYTLYAEVPDGVSIRTVELGGGNLEVEANGEAEVQVSTVSYPRPGTYEYFAVFSYDGFQAEDRGSVLVQREEDPGEVYIEEVDVSPDLPWKDETVNFTVFLGNTYSHDESLEVTLYINGSVVDQRKIMVPANSENLVSLAWYPGGVGKYSYRIEVSGASSNLNLGTVDTYSGDIEVFGGCSGVSFSVWPRTLEVGERVFFTLKVRSYWPKCVPEYMRHLRGGMAVRGFIEDEDGAEIVKLGDGVVYSVPDGQEESSTFTFSHTLYSVGNHTFRLFFDPDDGTPNGEGEEHWKEVTVEVKPTSGTELKQLAFECDDLYFTWEFVDYHATLTCRAILYNPTDEYLTIVNSSKGKLWIETFDSGVSISPSSFNNHLSKFDTDVSNAVIPPQGTTMITFKSEISGVPLLVLEYFWGSTYSIEIPYTVHFENTEVFSAIGSGYGKITQNNLHVVADTVLNVFLFKGSISAIGEIKTVMALEEVSKVGDAIGTVVGFLKEIAGWNLWFNN